MMTILCVCVNVNGLFICDCALVIMGEGMDGLRWLPYWFCTIIVLILR